MDSLVKPIRTISLSHNDLAHTCNNFKKLFDAEFVLMVECIMQKKDLEAIQHYEALVFWMQRIISLQISVNKE